MKAEDLDMNPQFQRALDLLEQSQKHLFITGKAGTGKSTLLDLFCKFCADRPVVLAPTGVAALNVKGQTIHRFFNFYIDVTPEKIISKKRKPRDPKLYQKIRTIIIDEASMLRADLLDCIDTFLRIYGPLPSQPFGGVQMVFVGDLYQLPPVVNREENDVFKNQYATPYFFSAKALENAPLEVVELETVYRQKDQDFVELLNKIRNNSVEAQDIDILNQRLQPDFESTEEEDFTIALTTTNARANEINEAHLNALKGKLHTRTAKVKGEFGKEYFPTETDFQFKIGAQVMLLNNDSKSRWVNGSIGIIEALKKDPDGDEYMRIRLSDNDKLVSVYPYEWEVFTFAVENENIVSEAAGSFLQYPMRLAWAVTIHKSQGKTFDQVVIDIGRGTFAPGQTYVALSRCTSFEGIRLKVPIQKRHILTDGRIHKFLTSHAYQSALEKISLEKRFDMIEEAISHQHEIQMTYLKPNDSKSSGIVRPITIGEEDYQGKKYPGMKAFCENHRVEKMFHVGRILDLKVVYH